MGLIFLLSAQSDLPGRPSHWLLEVASNVGHFLGYALLAFWLWRALRHNPTASPGQGVRLCVFLLAFVIAVLYGVSDEYHQSFVPRRDPSPLDLLVDALGAATALGVLWRRGVDTGRAETNPKDTTSTEGTK
jgi:VanZ family protein